MSASRPSWSCKLEYEDPANGIPHTVTVAWGEDKALVEQAALRIFEALTADNLGIGRTIGGNTPRITHASTTWREFMVFVQADDGDKIVSLVLGINPEDWQD